MEDILKYIEDQREKVIELQQNLVSIPALGPENGGSGELDKANFLLSYLKNIPNITVKEFFAKDKRVPSGIRPNIMALLPGENRDVTVWVASHLDVVPPGDLTLWKSDPFTLKIEGDLIYGRGVEDNHQGIVSSIIALEAFAKNNVKPKYNFGVLLVSDEETGNKFGLEFLFNNHKDIFSNKDFFLIPDFGSKDSDIIEIAEKGMLWIKITVIGKQCHGSVPHKGINTLVACSAFILKLRELYSIFNEKDAIFSPPISTFEPTKKEQNVPNINTIPGKDVFYVDCRILPQYSLDEVLNEVQRLGREIEDKYKVKIEYEIVHKESSPPTNKENVFIKKLANIIEEECNVKPRFMGVGGGTVAVYPRKAGIAAAVWATVFETAHQPNEHSSITNTLKDAKVMARLLT